jgi:SulP family sulfate permease
MLATGSLIILIFLFKLSPKIPAAALVFFLSGILVASLKFPHIALLGDIGFIPSDLPSLTLPVFDVRIIGKLIPLAFAIMLLSILETTTIGRSYTSGKEPPYNDNQEIYGLGIGNLITAFLGCMPSSGSFSRSALNFSLRPKTRFSSVFSGVFVLLFVVLFGLWIKKIPLAALSALMILTAYTMVNFRDLKICLKGTRGDAFVVIVTFLSTLFFTLDVALYVGIALSIALYLRHASTPRITEYSFNNFGKLRPLEEGDRRPDPRICIFQAEGELFFGAAELFQSKMHQIIEDENIKVVILQLLNIRYLDASVCLALEKIYTYLEGTHRYLLLAGITPEVRHILKNTGVMETLGSQNCFAAKGQLPSEPTREAYAYAKTLINIPLI